jgi:hypothetical protein
MKVRSKNVFFCIIQQKILQNSNFANNRDMTPFPQGETVSCLAEMFAQSFFEKINFRNRKHLLCYKTLL